MDYRDEDRWLFNMKDETSNKTEGLTLVCWLVCLIVVAALVGCDSEAAEVTSKIEQDAYERYADVQAVARYRITDNPIKASTLEVSLTICQQYPDINHKWQCFGVK